MSKKFAKNVSTAERAISLLAGSFIVYKAIKSFRCSALPALAAGGYLLFRGGVGYCPINRWLGKKDVHNPAINIKTVLTINKPRAALYQYWRKLENLPMFMRHLQEVTEKDEKTSHWIAKMPGTDGTIEWDAEIVKDEPNYLIGWQSTNGSPIKNAGKVQFFDAPRQGTEVRVIYSYHPPAGGLGTGIAKLLNPFFRTVIEEEIRNFKRIMEMGEIPATQGQPAVP